MKKTKTKMIDGHEYEELGPYCQLCGAHMGQYYFQNATYDEVKNCHFPEMFLNPHKYESYGDNKCPSCKAKYVYDEGNVMVLTKADYDAIRKVRGI
jgi:hypothetical protein